MHDDTMNAPKNPSKLTLRQEVDRLQELCAHQAERIEGLEKSSRHQSKRIEELEHQVFTPHVAVPAVGVGFAHQWSDGS